MKTFYTIVLMICSVPVFSQNIEDYLSRCQYQQAIDYLEQQNDTSRVAEMQKVLCYNSLQNYSKAIDILLNLHEKYPEDPTDQKSKEELIKIDINQENYQMALENSEKFLVGDTNNVPLNILKALSFYYLDQYNNAIKVFEKCRLLGDTSLVVNKYLGVSYFYSQQDKNAYPYLVQAYNQDTTNNSVLYALATVNKNLENFPEAIRLYERLIQKVVPPANALYTYYKSLADSYDENKDIQPAIDNYKKALIYFSDYQDMELLFLIADLYDLHVHDYKLAIDYYQQYKGSLVRYGGFLAEKDSTSQAIRATISDKIKYLDERITYLGNKIEKSNSEKK